MNVALGRLLTAPDTPFYARLRDIENNYYLETTPTTPITSIVTAPFEP